MEAAGRCIRPEVIFVLKRSGAQIGVTIDEPLYARILIGDVEYLTVIGAVPPRYMLRRLSARAHPAVLGVLAK